MVVGCKKDRTMKRLINILATALFLVGFVSSCEKAPKLAEGIIGEWQLAEMDGQGVTTVSTAVYIEFKSDLSFDMYQKVGDIPRYRKYVGTYSIAGSILSGNYKDGKKWGSAYRASLEADGEVLVLTAVTLDNEGAVVSEGEVSKYIKASLPQTDKDAADVVTKSSESVAFRIL